MRIRVSNGANSFRNPDIKLLRECAIAGNGVRHLVEDGRRFASANSKPGCQLKEVAPFDAFAEAADRCHMLAFPSRRSDKIIGGRHGPSPLGVHQERKKPKTNGRKGLEGEAKSSVAKGRVFRNCSVESVCLCSLLGRKARFPWASSGPAGLHQRKTAPKRETSGPCTSEESCDEAL